MRVFMNMGLSEYTGYGVPTILSKYGEDAFEIGKNYILITIPYNNSVINKLHHFSYKSFRVCENNVYVDLNKTEKHTLQILLENPNATTSDIANRIGVTTRTIERAIKSLREKEFLMRSGSKKRGKWIVMK